MKVDENGWKWIQISAGLLASLMPFLCHLNFSALSDCRVIGYFGQLFITIHTKIIEHHFLKMDVYHKIDPSILWSQSSDWLLIVTFITKGSFPPDQLLLDIFPPQYWSLLSAHNILEQWSGESLDHQQKRESSPPCRQETEGARSWKNIQNIFWCMSNVYVSGCWMSRCWMSVSQRSYCKSHDEFKSRFLEKIIVLTHFDATNIPKCYTSLESYGSVLWYVKRKDKI